LGRYYLDTSALVKLYVREPGTDTMLRLANGVPQDQMLILALAPLEFRSAVRRREREGDVTTREVDALLELFEEHLSRVFVRHPITDRTLEIASRVIDDHGLRAYDALQLAGCLALLVPGSVGKSPTFICADDALLRAADSEGLPVFNPISDKAV
jgi:uncharacterized protein